LGLVLVGIGQVVLFYVQLRLMRKTLGPAERAAEAALLQAKAILIKIQSPQRHAKQEPHPGHDTVAIADAHASLFASFLLAHSTRPSTPPRDSKPVASASRQMSVNLLRPPFLRPED
jgi:hypothetical protein